MKRLLNPYIKHPVITISTALFVYLAIALLASKIAIDPSDQIMTEEEDGAGLLYFIFTIITSILVAPLLVGKK